MIIQLRKPLKPLEPQSERFNVGWQTTGMRAMQVLQQFQPAVVHLPLVQNSW
ncbi:MAG TPA: hypothetical protein VE954_29500 [Oligoflexus sp.]|nr:hypothetical protein [Oligoflexus sp.]HYX37260.1 hypothetical protein [Oligoflexus sp.]